MMIYLNENDYSDPSTFIGFMDGNKDDKVKIEITQGDYKGSILSVTKYNLFTFITNEALMDGYRIPTIRTIGLYPDITYAEKIERIIQVLELKSKLDSVKRRGQYISPVHRPTFETWKEFLKILHDPVNSVPVGDMEKIYGFKTHTLSINSPDTISGTITNGGTTIDHVIYSLTNFDTRKGNRFSTNITMTLSFKENRRTKNLNLRCYSFKILDDQTLDEVVIKAEATIHDIYDQEVKVGNFVACTNGYAALSVIRITKISSSQVNGVEVGSGIERIFKKIDKNCILLDETIMDRLLLRALSR